MVSSDLFFMLRSTNQRIQLGLARGQESARRPPVGVDQASMITFSLVKNRTDQCLRAVNNYRIILTNSEFSK